MKNFLLLLVCALVFTSCNFTEEITFKEDGSGEFVMNYDLSEVMKIMENMDEGDDMEGEDGYQDDEDYDDEYEDEEMENEEDMEPRNKKPSMKMDSVMYFSEMLVLKADSIATLPQEEQDRLKSFENVMVKMKMDEDAGIFDFGIGSTFNSIAELPEALEKMNDAKKMNSKDNKQMSQMENSAVSRVSENMFEYVAYNYNGKTFTRIMKDNYNLSSEDSQALDGEINQMGGDSKVMFQAMTYTLVYNFPRAIKSVSNANASLSDDKKTVTLTMNFLDMVKNPEMMNLNVILEK